MADDYKMVNYYEEADIVDGMEQYYRGDYLEDPRVWDAADDNESLNLSFNPLIWITAEGERLPLTKMGTSHLFNAMKMCFNHLAERHGGQPIQFTKHWHGARQLAVYKPEVLATWVVAMLTELDRRRDIPFSLIKPLEEIRGQLMPKRLEKSNTPK